MRLLSLFVTFFFALFSHVFGSQRTFILQDIDSKQFLIKEGDVTASLSPYSTFKIPLSLIGFDTKTLQDTENPVWPFKKEYQEGKDFFLEGWKAPHNPTRWMQNSCVWYSQLLTQKLGMEVFSNYVSAFGYGNQNLSGDAGQANGLTNAWLGSSLRISPLEQNDFINKLVKQELPVSIRAHELTKAILFVENLPNDMVLYGKVGSGSHAKGQDTDLRVAWFVGWVEQGNKRLSFVYMLQGNEDHISGAVAREQLKQKLLQPAERS